MSKRSKAEQVLTFARKREVLRVRARQTLTGAGAKAWLTTPNPVSG